LNRKTRSQRSHVFRLTGTAALHCGHTFVGGILTANSQQAIIGLTKNISLKNKMATSHVSRFIRTRVFRGVKNGRLHVAVPTGNALASQRSIFRENRLKFSTFICHWEG